MCQRAAYARREPSARSRSVGGPSVTSPLMVSPSAPHDSESGLEILGAFAVVSSLCCNPVERSTDTSCPLAQSVCVTPLEQDATITNTVLDFQPVSFKGSCSCRATPGDALVTALLIGPLVVPCSHASPRSAGRHARHAAASASVTSAASTAGSTTEEHHSSGRMASVPATGRLRRRAGGNVPARPGRARRRPPWPAGEHRRRHAPGGSRGAALAHPRAPARGSGGPSRPLAGTTGPRAAGGSKGARSAPSPARCSTSGKLAHGS